MPATLLNDFSLLRFSGPDSATFLQGQLTCDVQALKPGSSSYGGYCNPKGRLLATFLLWPEEAGFYMLLPAAIAEPIRKRLSMYILRSKVKAEDMTAAQACIGVSGTDTASQVSALGGQLPQRQHGVTSGETTTTVALPGNRCLMVMSRESVQLPAESGPWSSGDITCGIPFILPATQEEFVPQMVNLDLIGALSYTKGCYPGQEIVARTHYLGKLKQRMFRAAVAGPAAPGDKLYCEELGDQASGMIVSAAPSANGHHDVLAVLQTAYAKTSVYHCGSLLGATLSLTELPYQVN
jgi:folate-binding protein YgfZ